MNINLNKFNSYLKNISNKISTSVEVIKNFTAEDYKSLGSEIYTAIKEEINITNPVSIYNKYKNNEINKKIIGRTTKINDYEKQFLIYSELYKDRSTIKSFKNDSLFKKIQKIKASNSFLASRSQKITKSIGNSVFINLQIINLGLLATPLPYIHWSIVACIFQIGIFPYLGNKLHKQKENKINGVMLNTEIEKIHTDYCVYSNLTNTITNYLVVDDLTFLFNDKTQNYDKNTLKELYKNTAYSEIRSSTKPFKEVVADIYNHFAEMYPYKIIELNNFITEITSIYETDEINKEISLINTKITKKSKKI